MGSPALLAAGLQFIAPRMIQIRETTLIFIIGIMGTFSASAVTDPGSVRPFCEVALVGDPFIRLLQGAWEAKRIPPEVLFKLADSETPANPFARLAMDSHSLPMKLGFDRALVGMNQERWQAIRGEISALLKQSQGEQNSRFESRENTRDILSPRKMGKVYLKGFLSQSVSIETNGRHEIWFSDWETSIDHKGEEPKFRVAYDKGPFKFSEVLNWREIRPIEQPDGTVLAYSSFYTRFGKQARLRNWSTGEPYRQFWKVDGYATIADKGEFVFSEQKSLLTKQKYLRVRSGSAWKLWNRGATLNLANGEGIKAILGGQSDAHILTASDYEGHWRLHRFDGESFEQIFAFASPEIVGWDVHYRLTRGPEGQVRLIVNKVQRETWDFTNGGADLIETKIGGHRFRYRGQVFTLNFNNRNGFDFLPLWVEIKNEMGEIVDKIHIFDENKGRSQSPHMKVIENSNGSIYLLVQLQTPGQTLIYSLVEHRRP